MNGPRGTYRPVRLAPLDIVALGLVGLRSRRIRAALSALGISIGIATMVVVMGIPASSERALMNELAGLGTNLLQVSAMPNQNPPVRLSEKAAEMALRIGPVTEASAVANTHTTIARNDRAENNASTAVLAARLDVLDLLHGSVRAGRWFDTPTEQFPTVVLGAEAAGRLGFTSLSGDGPPPQLFIGRRWFTLIGILDPIRVAPEIDRAALVGWPAARQHLRFDGRPTVVYVRSAESAVEKVRDVLPATVHPEVPGMVRVSRPSDALAAKRATESTFGALFLGLAGIALLVGGIGVANTMVISVLERRREIGLRRALGANRGQIRSQFLAESVALSLLGGLTGTVLGAVATVAYALHQHWPPVVPLSAVAGGVGGATLVGIVAGVYPSMRAARLTPTEALATT
jgi:putative ABC transport system permease protein